MKITMLGTGNALVTECYNTCFVLSDGGARFMVDAGGGNTVLRRLKQSGIDLRGIHEIFVTHKHTDHILGMVWIMRMICQGINAGKCDGDANIYAHDEVVSILRGMAERLLNKKELKHIGERLRLVAVSDGESRIVNGRKVTFFDIHSTKAKQFGFCMELGGGRRLTCCGDEPYNELNKEYAEGSDWLLHEAFCLSSQADVFHPYEKNHSTVKDACELAQKLGVKNLLLYHTEDSDLERRKELYAAEGRRYFGGNIFVPDDLETLEL